MQQARKLFWPVILFVCLGLFIFSRLYILPQTLYFWGDIGRDHEVLIEMVQSHRPILLGPSNSQLPFNQSAWYFYLNLPIFILSGYSAYTTAITGLILMLVAFIICIKNVYPQKKKYFSVAILILLLTFQPIILAQQRSTWNPAFAIPFILVATSILWQILHKKILSPVHTWLFPLMLVFAVGMTYAAVPLCLVFICLALSNLPVVGRWRLLIGLILSTFLVFVPHLLFEARHGFLLTKQLLTHPQPSTIQTLTEKLTIGSFAIWGILERNPQQGVALAFLTLLIGLAIGKGSKKNKEPLTLLVSAIVLSFVISCLFVSEFNSHYSLLFSVVLLFIVSMLPKFWSGGASLFLILLWLPFTRTPFTQQPHRTVAELEQCAKLVCKSHPEPMFVAAQAWHSFHSGYDYSFFFNKNGCQTRDIGTNPQYSNTMALVVDRSRFDPVTTSFYELSLFGPKRVTETQECKAELSVIIFEKE